VEESNFTVIIPTLNEEENIGRLSDKIHEILPQALIIVVDDGSEDKTREIANATGDYVTVIDRSNEEIKGLTISIRDAINSCTTKAFMVIDGDFQHPPESLLDAIDCFKLDADLVIGFRIKVEDWPFSRKLMSFTAQSLGKLGLIIRRRQRPKDIMSGFFGGKTEIIKPVMNDAKLALKGYKLLYDVLKAFPRDGTIEQFGYIFKNREFGDSKIGKTQIWQFFKSIF